MAGSTNSTLRDRGCRGFIGVSTLFLGMLLKKYESGVEMVGSVDSVGRPWRATVVIAKYKRNCKHVQEIGCHVFQKI